MCLRKSQSAYAPVYVCVRTCVRTVLMSWHKRTQVAECAYACVRTGLCTCVCTCLCAYARAYHPTFLFWRGEGPPQFYKVNLTTSLELRREKPLFLIPVCKKKNLSRFTIEELRFICQKIRKIEKVPSNLRTTQVTIHLWSYPNFSYKFPVNMVPFISNVRPDEFIDQLLGAWGVYGVAQIKTRYFLSFMTFQAHQTIFDPLNMRVVFNFW